MVLAVLARLSSRVNYYVRCTIFLAGLGGVSFYGLFVSIIMSLLGQRHNINFVIARSFYQLVGTLLGIRFRIEGKENLAFASSEPCVVVGNHQSMFDILYLGAMFPKRCSIMAKRELKWTPFLGQFMTLSNAVFIDRKNRKSALDTFSKVAAIMKLKSTSLFIFVEGTRNGAQTPSLLPFKKGAFHFAVQGQLPIVPVVCENYWNLYSSKIKRCTSGEIGIKALDPIPTMGLTSSHEDIALLAEKTRKAMLDALEEMARRPESVSGSKIVQREPMESSKRK